MTVPFKSYQEFYAMPLQFYTLSYGVLGYRNTFSISRRRIPICGVVYFHTQRVDAEEKVGARRFHSFLGELMRNGIANDAVKVDRKEAVDDTKVIQEVIRRRHTTVYTYQRKQCDTIRKPAAETFLSFLVSREHPSAVH